MSLVKMKVELSDFCAAISLAGKTRPALAVAAIEPRNLRLLRSGRLFRLISFSTLCVHV
jgi:hypothetical protein